MPMDFSCLSPHEVHQRYEQAANKRTIIPILAEMTCSTSNEVREFLGLQIPKKRKVVHKRYTVEQWNKALEMYQAGALDVEISDETGISRTTVLHWRSRNGYPSNYDRKKPKGINGNLSAEANNLRMKLYEEGLVDIEIANKVGCSQSSIYQWRKRRGLPPNGTVGGNHKKRRWKNAQNKTDSPRGC